MSRWPAAALVLSLLPGVSCALGPTPKAKATPREIRFYTADNPTELSQIVNGTQGCAMIQVVPWKEAFIAVMDCPFAPAATPACKQGSDRCPAG